MATIVITTSSSIIVNPAALFMLDPLRTTGAFGAWGTDWGAKLARS
jgi:hypothetical protein